MKKNRYLIYTIIWMAVIFLFSAQNAELSSINHSFVLNMLNRLGIDIAKFISYSSAVFIVRKAAHLTEYLILGVLLYKTFKCYLYSGFEVFSIITGFLYACTDEFHQYFVPGRAASFMDVLIDTSGVVLGIIIIAFLAYRRQIRKGISF